MNELKVMVLKCDQFTKVCLLLIALYNLIFLWDKLLCGIPQGLDCEMRNALAKVCLLELCMPFSLLPMQDYMFFER